MTITSSSYRIGEFLNICFGEQRKVGISGDYGKRYQTM